MVMKELHEGPSQSLAKPVINLPKEPFMKWELDFVGPIKLAGRYT
jgi:hypothetical protein